MTSVKCNCGTILPLDEKAVLSHFYDTGHIVYHLMPEFCQCEHTSTIRVDNKLFCNTCKLPVAVRWEDSR